MSETRGKLAARQAGMLGVLAITVTIATLLFNLFGALSTAVLAGMMAGSSRRCNWQILCVSLVTPIVALALGQVTRVDLDLWQRLSVAGVCLGSFWAAWALTFAVMALEKRSTATTDRPQHRPRGQNPPPANNELQPRLNPRDLQGTWLCELNGPGEPPHKKVLVLAEDRFTLSVVNSGGDARLVAKGDLAVQSGDSGGRSQQGDICVVLRCKGDGVSS